MARKSKEESSSPGAPAWMATYGDMVTLLLCFFVLLFSMSSVDVAKFKAALSSFNDQIDVFPGGEALTEGELLNNGISQLNDIQVVFSGGMPNNDDGDDTSPGGQDGEDSQDSQDQESATDSETIEYQEQMNEAKEIAENFQDKIELAGYDNQVLISYTANFVKFTIQGEFLFDSARAELKTDALLAIGEIAKILKEERYSGYDIQIEGHTDNLDINNTQYPNNWILSSYRAYAVLEELLDVYDFDPEKVAATGYGEFRPIADNQTAEGRALNRRVEIKVLLEADEQILSEEETLNND
ncbi:MAG: flagellar motor protein MotB [Vallitaleaceae bacterium]|nr:flagellar motor protein MotB [Vallitaleaceae bacterium]